MKKILIPLCLLSFALPVFAMCSITTGTCTTSVGDFPSNVTPPGSNLENLVPNNVRDKLRTDSFQREYRKPYYDALINTESANDFNDTQGYNSNCQFGVCLPGGEFTPAAPDDIIE